MKSRFAKFENVSIAKYDDSYSGNGLGSTLLVWVNRIFCFDYPKHFSLHFMATPMTLVETIHENMKEAMRSGDTFRRDTLRFLESALKNAALEKRVPLSQFSDEDVHAVIRRNVKQRDDSAKQYRVGGRIELAEKEEEEKRILSSYLPAAPDATVIREAVQKAISEIGATSAKDMGKVMGIVMKSLPTAPGNDVRNIVSEFLMSK